MKPKVTTEFQHGQARIFKNPFLESLTKTNPIQNIIVYGMTIIGLIVLAINYSGPLQSTCCTGTCFTG